jgi:hypothetical protein
MIQRYEGAAGMSRRGFLAVPLALLATRWSEALGMVSDLHAHRRHGRGVQHPDPRPGITGENVLSDDKLPDRKRVRRAFEMARELPQIFDGLYCHCNCEKSHGHRSLLSCFESDQAIGCMACREEGELAYKLHGQGKTLDEIRAAVDEQMR